MQRRAERVWMTPTPLIHALGKIRIIEIDYIYGKVYGPLSST